MKYIVKVEDKNFQIDITERDGGLKIVGFENPRLPQLKGQFNDGGEAWGVDISGFFVYLLCSYINPGFPEDIVQPF